MFSAINSAYLPAYFLYIVLHSFVIERQDDNSKLLYFAVKAGGYRTTLRLSARERI